MIFFSFFLENFIFFIISFFRVLFADNNFKQVLYCYIWKKWQSEATAAAVPCTNASSPSRLAVLRAHAGEEADLLPVAVDGRRGSDDQPTEGQWSRLYDYLWFYTACRLAVHILWREPIIIIIIIT